MDYKIPFNRPTLTGKELEYVSQVLSSGHWSGDGSFTKRCHELLEGELQVPKVLLTTSGTHALEMAALLLDIMPGDEVILPSFTFVSTANAFALRGARLVFVDIRPDTLNIDESSIEQKITPKTKAIVILHYGGVGCEMETILAISKRHGIPIVEDNAHGLFGKYIGKCLGTFGCMGILSFHETKNFTCGEGGALILNDQSYSERAEILREKGTDRSRFFRGEVDKYTWIDMGSSYLPSGMQAAFLCAQLEAREEIQAKRKKIWQTYEVGLKGWAEETRTALPFIPKECEHSYHLFFLLLPTLEKRQALIQHLKERGILSVFHYLPLHLSPMGLRFGGKAGDCPVTEEMSGRLVRLPFFFGLTPHEQEDVILAVREFR